MLAKRLQHIHDIDFASNFPIRETQLPNFISFYRFVTGFASAAIQVPVFATQALSEQQTLVLATQVCLSSSFDVYAPKNFSLHKKFYH